MSKLNELRSKGQQVVLSNGMELNIMPMTLGEEADVAAFDDKQMLSAVSLLVKNAIKRAIPDATDEEIEFINKKDLKLITECVLKVNGLIESKNEEAMTNSKEN